MPKFAANLTLLFTDYPFIERFGAAREAGFDAVEVLFPYDEPAKNIAAALRGHGLEMILFNTPPPNWAGGDRGYAAIPGGQERFQHDLKRALRYAEVLSPRHIHIMAGIAQGDEAQACFIENLKWACAQAPAQSFVIEPLNPHDMPGYFLNSFDLAAEVLDTVNADNLGLQYDVYHAHRITGDAAAVWQTHGHRARHIQIGRIPDRADPVGGDFDFPTFFKTLDNIGYQGAVSGEYHPAGRTQDGLGWIRKN